MTKSSFSPAFWSIWAGQLVSNFATQVCLYSLGLYFLQKNGRLASLASIAITIQCAKVVVLPLLGRYLDLASPKFVMIVANIVRSLSLFGMLYAIESADIAFSRLVPLVFLSAAAEVALVISFTAIIDDLVPNDTLPRAVGMASASDGIVTQSAPLLGAITIATLGISGISVINAVSFVLTFALLAFSAFPGAGSMLLQQGERLGQRGIRKNLKQIWAIKRNKPLLLHSMTTAALLAALEILFPAWTLASMGIAKLNLALIVVFIGYIVGLRVWFWLGSASRGPIVFYAECIQAVVLVGAGLQVFQDFSFFWVWGILAFSIGIPIVCSVHQYRWQLELPQNAKASYLTAVNSVVWVARILAIFSVTLVVDRLLIPAIAWRSLPQWLQIVIGTDAGRGMALAICGLGLLQGIGVYFLTRRLCADL